MFRIQFGRRYPAALRQREGRHHQVQDQPRHCNAAVQGEHDDYVDKVDNVDNDNKRWSNKKISHELKSLNNKIVEPMPSGNSIMIRMNIIIFKDNYYSLSFETVYPVLIDRN